MNINNIAIYVDGPTEEGALKAKFCKEFGIYPSFRYGPGNGVNYSIEGYANNVVPKIIVTLKTNISSIILMPDLETREKKCKLNISSFSSQLKSKIIELLICKTSYKKEYLEDVIFICPSDTMFENWIVCDIEGLKSNAFIKKEAKQDFYDGKNGSSILKHIMSTKYKKTVHAKLLHKCVNTDIGIRYSPSYDGFIKTINILVKK